MHDSFEKEVQKKMEELSLTPSAPVWEKVEMEIQREKKRKKVFFWIPFLVLLLGGGYASYILFNDKKETPVSSTFIPLKNIDNDASTITKQHIGLTDTFKTTVSPNTIIKKQIDKNVFPKKEKDILQVKPKPDFKKRNATTSTIITAKNNKPETTGSSTIKQDKIQGEKVITTGKTGAAKTVEQKPPTINSININEQAIPNQKLPVVIDAVTKTDTKKEELGIENKKDSSVKKKVTSIDKKWKKQIVIAIGRSSYQNSSIINNALSFASAPTLTGSNAQLYNAQPTRAGTGFSIGFALSKDISQKWKLSVGLQYAHYTTHTNVGDNKRNDTTVNYAMDKVAVDKFFTNTGTNNYTNNFGVVELPLTISYQPSIKLPLCFSIGAAYGRLLSTNALTYSEASNIYYKNKDNYLRNTLPVFTSLQVKLVSKKNVSVCFGPSVQYNLLKLRKENRYYTPHLIFAGIKTAISF